MQNNLQIGNSENQNKESSKPMPQLKARRQKRNQQLGGGKTVYCEYETTTNQNEPIKHNYICTFSDQDNIIELVQKNKFQSFQAFQLHLEALKLKQTARIDRLVAVDAIRTKLIPYNFQLKTALQVINEMNSNAILADEVGLGKTIEAGLIMKELLLREEVNSVLIVAPKSLLSQWKSEMSEKFDEDFLIANKTGERVNFKTGNRILCSHTLLPRRFEKISNRTWDLIIIDEAHAFRNIHCKGRNCISELKKNHLLLLTATPLCNKLTDLYSIVDLVQPGMLDSERAFISRYAQDSRCRVIKENQTYTLKQTLNDVMCRTRREQTGIPFTKRIVESRTLDPTSEEREFIDTATDYLRDMSKNHFKTIEALIAENPHMKITEAQSNSILIFQAITLQQSFSSSPSASIQSLIKRQRRFPSEAEATNKLIEMANKVKSAKLELLSKILRETHNEQALIFCLRKITAHKIKEMLNEKYGQAAVFLGDMDQASRDTTIENFKNGDVKYLVATDAAAEGLNFQNCCLMFNYDLHWNPMKIEQRIGRIHRFKQERDVTVFNLSVKDTIDDYVLHILYQKIDLFTMTIGKMETVLAELKEGNQDIQKTIGEILLRSNSRLDLKEALEKLANDLNQSKQNQELAEQFTQGVIG